MFHLFEPMKFYQEKQSIGYSSTYVIRNNYYIIHMLLHNYIYLFISLSSEKSVNEDKNVFM